MLDVLRARFGKNFLAFERLLTLTEALLDRNRGKLAIATDRPSTQAVAALYAKAWKTAQAIRILASAGYGEDAVILARSLANLCINLTYISYEDSERHAAQWMAAGWWARKRMAQELGSTALDEVEHDYNTEDGKLLAAEWDSVNIRRRAELAGQTHIYVIAYRHGSSFEHSDSWSVQGYADVHDDEVHLNVGPGTNEVGSALFIAAFSLYQVVATVAGFYDFDLGPFDREAQRALDEGFGAPDDAEGG